MTSRSDRIVGTFGRLFVGRVERRGDRSGRPWRVCPSHANTNQSLSVASGEPHHRRFGFGVHRDAFDYCSCLNPAITFREAVPPTGGCFPVAKASTGPLECLAPRTEANPKTGNGPPVASTRRLPDVR